MGRAMELRRLSCSIALTLLVGVWASDCCAVDRLLIDDFNIDQAGIVTGRDAAFAPLLDPRLFAGGREISGGGASDSPICATCTMAAGVHDGVFEIVINDVPSGAGAATWPGRISATNIDISNYSFVTFDVVNIGDPVLSRMSLAGTDGSVKSVNLLLSSSGTHSIRIPSDFNRHALERITIAFLVGPRQSFAITSVELVVPEPAPHSMALIFAMIPFCAVRVVRRSQ